MTAPRKILSAIVAIYNDAQAIPFMYRRLCDVFDGLPLEGEFIFVNDASPDDAARVLAELARSDPRVVVINHSRNFGSQAAFSSGLARCHGAAAVMMDGDLQDPPELIPQFVTQWEAGFDVVYGVRVKREASAFLQFAYRAFYRVFHALSYVNVPLDAGDFSLIDRRVIDALNRLPERDRFLRGLRAWVGFRQTGVPYVRPERMFGVTTNNLLKNFAWARKGILSLSYVPLEMISYLALLVTALAAMALTFHVVAWVVYPGAPPGFLTLLTVVLFLGGIQLICLAILGDYLGRVFEETKQRPLYIVRSIWDKHHPPEEDSVGEGSGEGQSGPAGQRSGTDGSLHKAGVEKQ